MLFLSKNDKKKHIKLVLIAETVAFTLLSYESRTSSFIALYILFLIAFISSAPIVLALQFKNSILTLY